MSVAIAVLMQTLRLLTSNIGNMFYVLLPALLWIFAGHLIGMFFAGDILLMFMSPQTDPPTQQLSGATFGSIAALIVAFPISFGGYILLAIRWHRYVLLDSGSLDNQVRPSSQVFWRYFRRALVLGFVQLLIAFPMLFLMVFVAPLGGGTHLFAVIGGVAVGTVLLWINLRFGLILPDAALDQFMSLGDSWTETAPLATAIPIIAVTLVIIGSPAVFLTGPLLEPGYAALVLDPLFRVIQALVFISVLTTLYGHLIQGRDLR